MNNELKRSDVTVRPNLRFCPGMYLERQENSLGQYLKLELSNIKQECHRLS